jgi:antitoxin component YwqK of YwqJK toxin-antitoxin module
MKYLFAILVLIFTCKSDKKSIEVKNSKGIVIQRITNLGDTSLGKNGLYETFDDEGKPLEAATYVNGKLEGEKRIYYEGALYNLEYHKNDLYEGPYKVFYPNGQIQIETQYINNEITGELRGYYPTGKLKEIVTMKANVEDGPFTEYYESGIKKAEGSYKPFENGPRENGLLILYDSTGALLRKMNCVDGVCNTIKEDNK